MTAPRPIELLAPAKDVEVARQAILHGADAVYIGAESYGARKSAGNSVDDIAELVQFAHQFRSKVYVTVNTIIYENELAEVQLLIRRLYRAGVDALIVQDMGILRMDIPPIELHASTQCDTRTPAKARFLEEVGFSQIVLARELSIEEIKKICQTVKVPVECFVHGALCVSYSGRCSAGYAATGRSANRGECPQLCRHSYTLYDGAGSPIVKDKYLLSLRDFNASHSVADMIDAGVSSFKIEGRLKDSSYVKNTTAYYRRLIDRHIAAHPDKYCRASFGSSCVSFHPDPTRSFNRGFSDYFLTRHKPRHIASLDTPKSLGVPVTDISQLENGDGISFFDKEGRYTGAYVNGVDRKGNVRTSNGETIGKGTRLYLTYDKSFEKETHGETAVRKIALDVSIYPNRVEASDERGCRVVLPLDKESDVAKKPMDFKSPFTKLGNTIYELRSFESYLPDEVFLPMSYLTSLRRQLIAHLDAANLATYTLSQRRPENRDAIYPDKHLIYSDNVSNSLAAEFYKEHGVKSIEPALETASPSAIPAGTVVMTTRHCILRELGCCIKEHKAPKMPLTLASGRTRYALKFDCDLCCMELCTTAD